MASMLRLQNRVAILTGAARGIGLACARRFADEGAALVLADRDETAGAAAAASIPGAEFVGADVSRKADVDAIVARALERHGRVDLLVNNAGITHACDFLELAEEDFDRVLAVNLKSMFLCGQAVARAMVKQGIHGAIVNISSANAVVAIANQVPYVVSKGGINQLDEGDGRRPRAAWHPCERDWPRNDSHRTVGGRGADRRCRAPGRSCREPSWPLRRTGRNRRRRGPFLASDDASYLTGQTISSGRRAARAQLHGARRRKRNVEAAVPPRSGNGGAGGVSNRPMRLRLQQPEVPVRGRPCSKPSFGPLCRQCSLALAGSRLPHADIFTWTDESGRVNISNLTPPDGVRVTARHARRQGSDCSARHGARGCPRILAGGRSASLGRARAAAAVRGRACEASGAAAGRVIEARRPRQIIQYFPPPEPQYAAAAPPVYGGCDFGFDCGLGWGPGFYPYNFVVWGSPRRTHPGRGDGRPHGPRQPFPGGGHTAPRSPISLPGAGRGRGH